VKATELVSAELSSSIGVMTSRTLNAGRLTFGLLSTKKRLSE
jgi:hypothetical protein